LDEKDISKKLKSLDFSIYSAKHKEQLWKTLSVKNDRRVLQEHELNIAAAGNPESDVSSNIIYSKCPSCGKQSFHFVAGKGAVCDECGFKTKRLAN
jgi:ribosomal protein L37E